MPMAVLNFFLPKLATSTAVFVFVFTASFDDKKHTMSPISMLNAENMTPILSSTLNWILKILLQPEVFINHRFTVYYNNKHGHFYGA